ncbi:alpha/beta hydrolase family protein [Solicola gregarius]|uniref:Secretory lipase n=1 Tax=Solicola gregarius TaxID=2908642 RepID=A0AA46TER9_9ACTN|nr:hypothetical protein [Solicola gregarius]UYM03529.1 hypothetical protein L0C25_13280 [Solicola gregarius]
MTLKRTPIALAAAAAIGLTAVPATAAQPDADPSADGRPDRGSLVSVRKVADLSANGVGRYLRKAGWDGSRARYGIDAYRMVYRTVGVDGEPTRASGLAVLPDSDRRRLRVVSYAHGTTSYRPNVASAFADDFLTSPGLTYASAGFAAALPDYLGLGKSPGTHPWMHVPSETSATVDMLRATRTLAHRHDRELRRGAYVSGFSQGASAALGTARRLQRADRRWFRPAAVAPISGAYDMAGVEIPAMLRGRLEPKMTVAYTAYFLVAWDRLHNLYDRPSEVFERPYAGRVARLFDGSTPGRQMLAKLPDRLDGLLTEQGRHLFAHPTPRLRHALRVADGVCKKWKPAPPVRLYVARRDEQAATGNTFSCARSFRSAGVRTPIDLLGRPSYGGSRHLGSNVAGTAAAVKWFLRMDRRTR